MCWYTDPLLKTCRHIVIKDIQKNISIGAYEHEMHGIFHLNSFRSNA